MPIHTAAETVTETQTSLFGDEDVAQNLYLERAKILDGALSRIKQDRATFKVLRERANVISQEGNVLNQEANERRLEDDARIQAYLSAEANRKGPISDALTDAARKLKAEPRSIARITGEFLTAVQSLPAAGQGVGVGGSGVAPGGLGEPKTSGIRQEARDAEGRGPDGEDRQDTGRDDQALSLFGDDPAPVAPTYPTTLEQVAQKPMAGLPRLSHIYAEYRGGRYYLASVPGNPDSAAGEWKKSFPKASVYTTDRADGASIDGDMEMLEEAIAAQQAAEAPAASTFEPGADGLPQAIMPGMEGGQDQTRAKMTERQRLEYEAKLKQSKMRRLGGNDGDAGPLFGNGTDDMFAAQADSASAPAITQKPVTKSEAKPANKIEDFGEKIGGARKDVWGGFKDRMDAAEALDIKAEPLSKSWPEPNYEKLIEAGVDAWTVGFVRAARESIPRKPSASWRLKPWVASVKELRKFAADLMNEEISASDVRAKLEANATLASRIGNKVDLYMAVGHGKSLKDLQFREVSYSMKDGVYHSPSLVLWEVSKERKATSFSNMPTVLASARTKDEAIAKFKAVHKTLDDSGQKKGSRDKGAKFQIYGRKDGDGTVYCVIRGHPATDSESIRPPNPILSGQ